MAEDRSLSGYRLLAADDHLPINILLARIATPMNAGGSGGSAPVPLGPVACLTSLFTFCGHAAVS